MAQLRVGDVTFHFATVRTESLTVTPVRDPSDRFLECLKTSLEIVGVVNRVCVSSNKPNPLGVGAGNEGDSLAFSIKNLTDYLLRERRPVTYTVAGTTILDVPRKRADNVRFYSDVRGGPFPRAARFTNFAGEKTAILHFALDVYDTQDGGVILSHNWSSRAAIDERGYTTRVVNGRLALRRDMIDRAILNGNADARLAPDFFRRVALPPRSEGMRRYGVNVEQPASGDELNYVCVDREVDFGIGENNGAVRLSGSVHCAVDMPTKNLKDSLKAGAAIARKGLALDVEGMIGLGIDLSIPVNVNNARFRVEGRKGADRQFLQQLVVACAVDRFQPLFRQGGAGVVRGLSLSQHYDSDGNPSVDMSMDVYGADPRGPVNQINADAVFSTSNNFAELGAAFAGPNVGAPRLPDEDERGTWLRAILTQRLLQPNENTPDDWPADQNRVRI